MANLAARGANLRSSEEWSDLILVCQNQVFRVHKHIVCSKSPIIAVALRPQLIERGGFLEPWAVRIHESFDISTLQCMLEFIYTGTYRDRLFKSDCPPQSGQPGRSIRHVQPSHAGQAAYTVIEERPVLIEQDEEKREKRGICAVSEALVYHARVNRIAVHYGVVGLVTLSAQRVSSLLVNNCQWDAFCNLVGETKDSNRDNSLQEVMINYLTERISDFIKTNGFCRGEMGQDLVNNTCEAFLKSMNAHRPEPTSTQKPEPAAKQPKPEAQESEPAGKQPERVFHQSVQIPEPKPQEPTSADKQPERAVQEPKLADQQPDLEAKEPETSTWGYWYVSRSKNDAINIPSILTVNAGSTLSRLYTSVCDSTAQPPRLDAATLRKVIEAIAWMHGHKVAPGDLEMPVSQAPDIAAKLQKVLEVIAKMHDGEVAPGVPVGQMPNIVVQLPEPIVQESEPKAEGSKSAGKQPERSVHLSPLSLRRCQCIRCDRNDARDNPRGLKKVGFTLPK